MKNKILILALIGIGLVCCKQQDTHTPLKMPIDKNATNETLGLYNQLFESMKNGIMLGHQDDLAYGHGWYKEEGRSDVKSVTGDYPAVIGWELGHLENGASFNLDSIYFSDMKAYIQDTHRRGGITTVSWHGDNIVTGNTAWDCGQDSIVRTILPNGRNHAKYLTWLDHLADFFNNLKDDNNRPIPVVFRMYHEHTGDWFWWCAKQCTPEEYKQLWIMTLEYLRDKKNVHNLLYAYSPSEIKDEAHFLERYPGDEYVDIVGYDCYVPGKDSINIDKYKKAMIQNLDIVTAYATKSGKLPIIGETGMESVSDNTYFTEIIYPIINKYQIAWVLFWRNAWETDKPNHYYVPYVGHPAEKDFKTFSEKENILMNNDIK